MNEYNDGYNRHTRRAYSARMTRLVRIRTKLGNLSLLPKYSTMTYYFSLVELVKRQKMVAAAYKAWHAGRISSVELEFVKINAV